jgi:hypothetical protein
MSMYSRSAVFVTRMTPQRPSSAAADAASAGEDLRTVNSSGSAREKEGSVDVASEAQRKPRERTRSNMISNLLLPGPSIPV